ncbi:MAG: DUF2065 domain-containing protein [Alphaproteobacteria bacterium]|nr:MAG: DUF2065 domain-containing protein [Alphaproteobacteria bacterium]
MLTALGLVLVFEGLTWGLFPGLVKRLMAEVIKLPDAQISRFGLAVALTGALVIYLVL